MTELAIARTLSDRLDALLRALNPSEEWVFCPACGKEWNKLRRCEFWSGSRTDETYVCIRCAETTRAFPWLSQIYPLLGVTLEIRSGVAVMSYGAMVFRVEPLPAGSEDGIHLKIVKLTDPEHPVFKNNAMAAWFWVKEQFEKGEEQALETDLWKRFKKVAPGRRR